MSALPRAARRLLEHLERLQAPGSGASANEVEIARVEVQRLLERHGLTTIPRPASPRRRRGPLRLLTAGAPEAPLRVLPPVVVLRSGLPPWAEALGATLAEATGARAVVTDGPLGTALAFAGAGADPEVASSAWRMLAEVAEGRSERWCAGFAAAIDERLDATIAQRAVCARVARVAAWLDAGITSACAEAPLLAVDDDDESYAGAEAAAQIAL